MAKSNPTKSFAGFLKANPQPKGQDIKTITPTGVKADKKDIKINPDLFKLPQD